MNISLADLIEELQAAGLEGAALVACIRRLEKLDTPSSSPRSSAAIRQERYRQRNKVTPVTSQPSHSVTDVTGENEPSKKESPQTPIEKTTPLSQTPSVSSSSPIVFAEKPKAKPIRATRLPTDWKPSDRNRSDAAEAGVPSPMIDRMGNGFRDYWIAKAGKDGAKLDWDATWRNWCRREAERRGWAPALEQELQAPGQQPDGQFYHMRDSDEYEAWAHYSRKRLADAKGGWRFPSRWPPGYDVAAAT